MVDTLNILLNGARPANATSFASPFPDYDLAAWKTGGMAHLAVPAQKVANVAGGHTWEWPNLLPSSSLVEYQATGQAGTVTAQTDSFLGGSALRPSDQFSAGFETKTQYSTDPALGSGDWWYYEALVPLVTLCQIWGVQGGSGLAGTIVNNQIRLNFANSGTGNATTATPDATNLVNRSWLIGWGRRSGVGVIRWGLAGGGGTMTEVVNANAFVGALSSQFRIGTYADVTGSGYSANRRRMLRMLQLGVFNPTYQAQFEELALGYDALY